jgi:hypothetical protein
MGGLERQTMSTQESLRNKAGVLTVPATLAHLLDVMDHRPRGADATQYRKVAASLASALTQLDGPELDALLRASPAATELYENAHYAHAGLCRANLDAAMQAEQLATQAIARAARTQSKTPGP